MTTKHNESAFPVFDSRNSGQDYECIDAGMTLRDYFAAKAMQSFSIWYRTDKDTMREYARSSYEMADAMMQERGKQ